MRRWRNRSVSGIAGSREDIDLEVKTTQNNFHFVFNKLYALEGMINALERSRGGSWEAVSNRVSTLVEGSVISLSERLAELEQAVQSQQTTPIETDEATTDAETWAAMEQVMWAEIGKVKDQMQALCDQIQQNQSHQEKQLSSLKRFARDVEHHLEKLHQGALPPGTH